MRLTNTIRKAFVRAAMQDVPQIEYDDVIRSFAKKAAIEAMPPEVKKAYKKYPDWFADSRHYFNDFGSIYVPIPDGKSINDEAKLQIQALKHEMQKQTEQRRELERKLASAAMSCTTRKALAELLPEFAKYLPVDEPSAIRTLPAVANIVADFTNAGWPKDKKMKGTK
jgi:hypothetical protein